MYLVQCPTLFSIFTENNDIAPPIYALEIFDFITVAENS
jgi:hypothetical protein